MRQRSRIAFMLFTAVSSLLVGCSSSDSSSSTIVTVDENDPEMAAAITKARKSLPQFWQKFDRPANGERDFGLKVKVTDSNGTEHFWVTDIERRNGKISGVIDNDPEIVKNVKLGQRIPIPEADISDWMYFHNDKIYGNATLRPLFKTMPPDEAEKLRSLLAEP
jgi:uncharacterized protein YegJ (DUF2314 family)